VIGSVTTLVASLVVLPTLMHLGGERSPAADRAQDVEAVEATA